MYVVGTAGHVDHGKSTLVQALTGIDPDRLREEKERGLTIELGFAWLTLPSGREVSIVDVPGHERFIKNMLAGVGAIDLAMLVVAANESVMPQTREHLAILDLLRVRRGLAVITKKDLVDEEMVELVMAEVEDILKGTTLEGAPMVPVSAMTGDGLPDLLNTLDEMLEATETRKDSGRPRLSVDRAFHDARIRDGGHRHTDRRLPVRWAGGGDTALGQSVPHPGAAEPSPEGGHGRPRQAAGRQPVRRLPRRHPARRGAHHPSLAQANHRPGRPPTASAGRPKAPQAQPAGHFPLRLQGGRREGAAP